MTTHPDLPPWVAVLVAVLLVVGSGLTLIGAFGPLRLRTFYERVHAPTLGATFGAGCILIASMIFFSVLRTRPVLHEILIGAFLFLTSPVSLLLLVRAAAHREALERATSHPPQASPPRPE